LSQITNTQLKNHKPTHQVKNTNLTSHTIIRLKMLAQINTLTTMRLLFLNTKPLMWYQLMSLITHLLAMITRQAIIHLQATRSTMLEHNWPRSRLNLRISNTNQRNHMVLLLTTLCLAIITAKNLMSRNPTLLLCLVLHLSTLI
jgi:hypothetical protein